MTGEVLGAIIALGGVLLGILLQTIFTWRFERSKFLRDSKQSSYQQFIIALAQLSQHERTSEEAKKARASLVEARCRIALFGSKRVVSQISHLFENTNTFEDPLSQHNLYQVILEMRRDSVGYRDYGIKVDLFSLVFASSEKDQK